MQVFRFTPRSDLPRFTHQIVRACACVCVRVRACVHGDVDVDVDASL